MLLVDDSLVIRDARESDADILCSWWNNGEVMAHAGFPNGLSTSVKEIRDMLSLQEKERHYRLILQKDDTSVGEMSYKDVGSGIAEIGIKICVQQEQGNGLGTRYIRMLINELFLNHDFSKIQLDTNFNNVRAQHVYEKIGFTKVRVRIDAWKDQLGVMQSTVDYELDREQYLSRS